MMAQDGAVNSQGWRARGGGSVTARVRLGQAETTMEAQSGLMKLRPRYRQGLGCTGLLAGQRNWWLSLAGSNSGSGSRRRQNWETLGTATAELGASGLRWEGENVKWQSGQPPPPGLNKHVCGSRKVSCQISLF